MFFTFSANLGDNMTKVILFLIYVDYSTNIIEKCLTSEGPAPLSWDFNNPMH